MSTYRIVTDSTSDLSGELAAEIGVAVIPMDFILGNDQYRDDPMKPEISSGDFYARISAGELSRTNQISMNTFAETFEPILQSGEDVLYLGFSSGLSGTYNNSLLTARELAEKYPERKIYAVDTLCASRGEGLIVWYAARMRREGASIEETKTWIEQNRLHLHHWFTVDDLGCLRRGGRISGAAAVMGTVLSVKPVMHVNNEGKLELVEKVRGRRQSLDRMVDHMGFTAENPAGQMVFIGHSEFPDGAEYVQKRIAERFGVSSFNIGNIGPVIGAHMGKGALDFFYLGKDRMFGLKL